MYQIGLNTCSEMTSLSPRQEEEYAAMRLKLASALRDLLAQGRPRQAVLQLAATAHWIGPLLAVLEHRPPEPPSSPPGVDVGYPMHTFVIDETSLCSLLQDPGLFPLDSETRSELAELMAELLPTDQFWALDVWPSALVLKLLSLERDRENLVLEAAWELWAE